MFFKKKFTSKSEKNPDIYENRKKIFKSNTHGNIVAWPAKNTKTINDIGTIPDYNIAQFITSFA